MSKSISNRGLFGRAQSACTRMATVIRGAVTIGCLFNLSPGAVAQESLRNSLAGDAAAAARIQRIGSPDYTFKAGDFSMLAVPSMEMDWNDNVNISQSGVQQQDFILKPMLQLSAIYPLTQHNLLNFSVGIGYNDYLEHGQYSSLNIQSGSDLSFDVAIKDFAINFHDRFSYSQNSGTEAAVSGTALYGTFNNVAGLTTTWDLEDLILTLGYDHENSFSTASQFSYLESSSELPVARAGFKFRPDLTVGIEASASYMSYAQRVLNNNQTYSAGVYADWSPGPYLHVSPRAGYVIDQFAHTSLSAQDFHQIGVPPPPIGETIQTADLNSWYANLSISHQVNDILTYTLTASHELRPGIQSDAIQDTSVSSSVTLAVVKDVTLGLSLGYEHGNQGVGNIQGNTTGTYDWINGGLSAGYQLMKKLMMSLSYRWTFRTAGGSGGSVGDYTQNVVGLSFTYHP